MAEERWYDLGPVEELQKHPLKQLTAGRVRSPSPTRTGSRAISAVCNHPAAAREGHRDGDYVVCPWHHWKFHCRTGAGEPGSKADRVQSYALREEGGRLLVNLEGPASPRGAQKLRHSPTPRPSVERAPGRCGTGDLDLGHGPRPSPLLDSRRSSTPPRPPSRLGAEPTRIRLNDLSFLPARVYSKSATPAPALLDHPDGPRRPARTSSYEGFVHWADVILVSTPIRWGRLGALLQDGRAG